MTNYPNLPAVPHQLPTTISLPPSLELLQRQAQIEGNTMILPRKLTEEERSILLQTVGDAERWGNGRVNIAKSLEQVARIASAYPASNLSDAVLEARSEAYMVALEDVPTWAVSAAGKRWARGNVATVLGDKVNLSFPPSPPQLRLLALDEVATVRGHGIRAKKLLEAKVRKEISPDERARVLKNIGKAFPSVSAKMKALSMDEPRELTEAERRTRLSEMAQAVVDDAMGGAECLSRCVNRT